ncbi:MAG: hypothetical protein AB1644_13045 [Candidatus Zixiibacteriota bacterium]
MAYCPACKAEWSAETEQCPICGREMAEDNEEKEDNWVLIGSIEDKLSADFARETLTVYEIPAVIVSKSGFFGDIGLPLHSFYSGKTGRFEVSVLSSQVEEAVDVLNMALGEKWQRKE